MRFALLFCVAAWVGVALAGCVNTRSGDVKALALDGAPAPEVPALQVGDKVRVTVFGEDKITGDYEIDRSGAITLPLAGTLKAAGLTQPSLQAALVQRLQAGYLRNPKVTVETIAVRPFYILGEVEKPGEYPYRNGLDIWRAMALAGGQTYRASTSNVLIQHPGEPQWREYALSSTVAIGPGDVVRVPERWF